MKKILRIKNLDCALCAEKLENKLKKIKYVNDAIVVFFSEKIYLDYQDDKEDDVLSNIKKVVNKFEPDCVLDI